MWVFGPRNPLFQEMGIRGPVWGRGNCKERGEPGMFKEFCWDVPDLRFSTSLMGSLAKADLEAKFWLQTHWGSAISNRAILLRFDIVAIAILRFGQMSPAPLGVFK